MSKSRKQQKKELVWDSHKTVNSLIALGILIVTAFGAWATWHIAYSTIPEIKEGVKNITIVQRGRCLIPNAIYGIVKHQDEMVNSATIIITNVDTNETKVLSTNENGEWVESVGNFNNCWVGGDKIKISACLKDNKCYDKQIIYSLDGGGMQINFDINS